MTKQSNQVWKLVLNTWSFLIQLACLWGRNDILKKSIHPGRLIVAIFGDEAMSRSWLMGPWAFIIAVKQHLDYVLSLCVNKMTNTWRGVTYLKQVE